MRISDWSSDVCSSDLHLPCAVADDGHGRRGDRAARTGRPLAHHGLRLWPGLSLCPPAQCRGFPCVSGELLGFSAADWPRRFATIASMAEDLGGKPAVTQSSDRKSVV